MSHRNMHDALSSAAANTQSGLYIYALSDLALARHIARQGDTIRCKAIATYCTAAMQALFPKALDQAISAEDVSFRALLTALDQWADDNPNAL